MAEIETLPQAQEVKSQADEPVEFVRWTATVSRSRVRPNNEFQLRVQAEVLTGYHLYSVTQAPGGPVPTSILLSEDQPFTLWLKIPSAWPRPVKTFSPEFGMEIEYHAGKVIFDLYPTASADIKPGAHEITIQVRYQLCDDHRCLVPATTHLRVPIEVITGEAEDSGGDATPNARLAVKQAKAERLNEVLGIADEKKQQAELWRVVADDPEWELAYRMLAKPFVARADFTSAAAIFRKGIAANPESDELHAALVDCSSTPAAKSQAIRDFIRRFPKSSYSAFFISQAAEESSSPATRIKLLRQAYALCNDFYFSSRMLFRLCWELAINDPAVAAKLATAWLKSAERRSAKDGNQQSMLRDEANPRIKLLVALASCDRLLKLGKAKAAVALVEQIAAPDIPHHGVDKHDRELLALMRAKARTAAGEGQSAYDELIAHDHLLMSDAMLAAAVKLGAKLGKKQRQVEAEAWEKRLRADNVVATFEVPDLRGRIIKATDYLGHPLLVNAWNPGCAPCSRELPYIERLRKKYKPHGFDVLVINIWPGGTKAGKTLVCNLGYGFKLVHAPEGWKQTMGRFRKGDANFLIDQRGHVIARPHFNGSRDLAVADRLVKGLLKYGEPD